MGPSVRYSRHRATTRANSPPGCESEVYKEVVPRLAVAVAERRGGTEEEDLERHYRTALTILFRLMFVAYAEDSQLLPLHVNGEYTDHALKTIARRLSQEINTDQDLGFDNPPHTGDRRRHGH